MKLFKQKREPQIVDDRTELEKTFEEKGQIIGRKTGKVVQKSVDKIHNVKSKLEEDGTLDKLRRFGDKVDDRIDEVVNRVAKKGKQLAGKHKKSEQTSTEQDNLYYE